MYTYVLNNANLRHIEIQETKIAPNCKKGKEKKNIQSPDSMEMKIITCAIAHAHKIL